MMAKLLTMTLLALSATSAAAEEINASLLKTIQPVAQRELKTYQALITPQTFREYGFSKASEAGQAKLGKPMKEYMVRLDELQGYKAGSDPNPLLKSTDTIIYPLLVGSRVTTSISLGKINDKWQAVSFGGAQSIKAATRAMEVDRTARKAAGAADYFVVKIPALNLEFMGYRQQNTLMLIPMADDERLGFAQGAALPADKVFAALMPVAKGHDNLPR